jgi:transcriptional regulator with GAF, ATPase, and Fis domain
MALPPSDFTPASIQARLVAVSGPLTGEVLLLGEGGASIGRGTSNDICLADLALSRTHCTIGSVDGVWRIRDAHSSNGTFVNGTQVTDHALRDRDSIDLGESVFLFMANDAPARVPAIGDRGSHIVDRLGVADTVYLKHKDPGHHQGLRLERDLRALLAIGTAINALTTEDDLNQQLLELLASTLPADQIAIVAADADGEGRIVAVRQVGGSPAAEVNRKLFTQAMQERTSLLTRGAATELPEADDTATSSSAILCVPLVVRDRALGALYLTARDADAFDSDHLQFATAVANLSAVALDNVRQVASLHRERARLQGDLALDRSLVGRSAAMQRIYEMVAKVARADVTVLITGETGTGKELVARAVHSNSARAKRPFVAVNCAALTDTLLESELFGHERGAFTGAVALKKGRLEVADGGTLFLDEIGEMAPALQSKLLRVLQMHEFERVGGTRPVRVDIRVIAATNRDPAAEVEAGRFRSDLYHRLHVIQIHVPPLRERREDIPALAAHFLQRAARTAARPVRGLAPEAVKYLSAYDWPGNVRELENTIERAVVLGSSDYIVRDDLPDVLLEVSTPDGSERPRFHDAVRKAKMKAIVDAFREARSSYTDTARLLGLHPNYLHRLIKNLDLKSVLEEEP